MMSWPKSRWDHAAIAFVGAFFAAIGAYKWTSNVQFAKYAREYPHDGQDGFGAAMDGLLAGAVALTVVFVILLALQVVYVRRADSK